jgi:hypothetical protein
LEIFDHLWSLMEDLELRSAIKEGMSLRMDHEELK